MVRRICRASKKANWTHGAFSLSFFVAVLAFWTNIAICAIYAIPDLLPLGTIPTRVTALALALCMRVVSAGGAIKCEKFPQIKRPAVEHEDALPSVVRATLRLRTLQLHLDARGQPGAHPVELRERGLHLGQAVHDGRGGARRGPQRPEQVQQLCTGHVPKLGTHGDVRGVW